MRFLRTTKTHTDYWLKRKIDWEKDYWSTWNHPHRQLICGLLSTLNWLSVFEIGCAGGANIQAIVNNFPDRQVGGIDVNLDGLKFVHEKFPKAVVKHGTVLDMPLSDQSVDVLLTDMTLIYVGPRNIGKAIEEIKRVGRNYAVFCEFHSDSWWQRLKYHWTSGYYVYDYRKLLEKHGFFDIEMYNISQAWPGGKGEPFRYLIKAKIVTH